MGVRVPSLLCPPLPPLSPPFCQFPPPTHTHTLTRFPLQAVSKNVAVLGARLTRLTFAGEVDDEEGIDYDLDEELGDEAGFIVSVDNAPPL